MIKARFVGADKSMGFRNGKIYRINIIQGGNRNWLWVKELWGLSCPYESMAALERNWEFDKSYINGYRIK